MSQFFISRIKFLQIFETLLGPITNRERKPKTMVNHQIFFIFKTMMTLFKHIISYRLLVCHNLPENTYILAIFGAFCYFLVLFLRQKYLIS